MSKHTPTPWAHTAGSGHHTHRVVLIAVHAGMTSHSPLATIGLVGGIDEAIADAAFIVQACNAHDDLVATLRKVYAALKSDVADPDSSGDVTVYRLDGNVMYHAINTVRDALAKAGAA